MKLNKFIFLMILLFLTSTFSHALKTDRSQKIVIHATELSASADITDLEIYGSVSITQGTLKIQGDKLTVKTLNKNDKNESIINITGHPSSFQQTLNAKNKSGKHKTLKATANKAIYNTKSGIIHLVGNAHIKIDTDTISGNSILYNILTEHYQIKGDNKKRATMVIYPK